MLKSRIQNLLKRAGYVIVQLETLEVERGIHFHAMRELEALRGEAEIRRAEIESIIAHRDQIAGNLANQNEHFEKMFVKVEEAELRAEELSREVETLTKSAEDSERKVRNLGGVQREVIHLTEELEKLTERAVLAESKAAELESAHDQADNVQREVLQLTEEIEALTQRAVLAETKAEELESVHDLADIVQREALQLTEEIETLTERAVLAESKAEELEAARDRADRLAGELDELRARSQMAEEKVVALLERSQATHEAADQIQEAYLQLLEEHKLARAELESGKLKEAEYQERERVLIHERDGLAGALKQQQDIERTSSEVVENLRTELKEALEQQAEFWKLLESRQTEFDEVRAREQELLEGIEGNEDEKEHLRSEIKGLERELEKRSQSAEARVLQVLSDHEKSLMDLSEVRRTLADVETKLKGLQAQAARKNEAQDLQFDSDKIRNIVVVGAPYSRSAELVSAMAELPDISQVDVCNGWFPNDLLLVSEFPSKGRHIAATSLDASPRNLDGLRQVSAAIVLCIPDPVMVVARRAAAFFDQSSNSAQIEPLLSPAIEVGQFSDISSLVDWQIERFVPTLRDWLERWMNYVDERPNWPILTLHERELGGPESGEMLGAALGLPDISDIQLASVDEQALSEMLSADQLKRVLDAFPPALRETLSWSEK